MTLLSNSPFNSLRGMNKKAKIEAFELSNEARKYSRKVKKDRV